MKFNTKMDFKEAVREFKKNDKIRCRALCKVEDCPWIIYASKDSESIYWQVKAFNDDHTCPRETKNRLANRRWLAIKLVKKLRKFLNLKHSKALTYFKSKCDLELNKSSLTRALGDARHIMPKAPRKKRRKGVDEGPVGGKKQKITKMKRVYKEDSYRHCGRKDHDKRNCAKKKADDEAAAAASEANTENQQQPLLAAPEVPDEGNATEIEIGMSQPMVLENENEESHQVNQPQARPPKLPQKRRQPPLAATASIPPAATSAPPPSVSNAPPPATIPISNTPPPTSARINPMVGASAATASRLRNVIRFVPTPGFKPPRKFKK
ncbi:hypothetical protein Ahy_A09g041463 [Arachis hypogaea]|uniref:Transposase MuDR plant domain-containing protein n=1 Tax=Arachis hypogaea TaxID=3818 RepID=A0A445BCW8_ARAHY|nr:hypothetical protein Ahy_A09g041463 [Arachis hypogaea]